jgi:ABC-type nitrate/sulfonate/bicarbonate transport system substrate-binding protein
LASFARTLLIAIIFATPATAQTLETVRVSYGGYNETAAPMWVGIEKGIFKKYGIDASMIQVRSGALSVAALVAKEVDAVWPVNRRFSARFSAASSWAASRVRSIKFRVF